MVVGLTGGIASGKSTVAQFLQTKGAVLVDADQIAREVVEPGSPVLGQVEDRFGRSVIQTDGSLNRRLLGEIVFHDEQALKDLEGILHPPIRRIILNRMRELENHQPESLVVVDIPLLYEAGWADLLPEVMVVYVPENIQLDRLMERDKLDREEALNRLRKQWPMERKRGLADVVIDNSGTPADTIRQLEQYLARKGLI